MKYPVCSGIEYRLKDCNYLEGGDWASWVPVTLSQSSLVLHKVQTDRRNQRWYV